MDDAEKELLEQINREESAYEMAQLGIFSNEALEIWVYGGEGPVPHFHFKNDSKKIEGCIRLDKSEYFPHGGKDSVLNSIQRKALVIFLNSPSDDIPSITNWQAIVFLWNTNNRKYQIPTNAPIPNYQGLVLPTKK